MSSLAVLLLTLAVVLGLARACGALLSRLGQPAVIGEIACGVLAAAVLPAGFHLATPVWAAVDGLAQLGLILFLFGAGARLATSLTRSQVSGAVAPALGAALVPFALGAVLAVWLAPRHATAGTGMFVVFTGAAMAVTALPVLARILADRDMLTTAVGRRALTVAALIDAAAWITLAVAAAPLHDVTPPVWAPLLLMAVLGLVLLIFEPWFAHRLRQLSRGGAATLMIVLACGAAAVTDIAGLHAAIGAFLAGAVVGRSGALPDPAALVAPIGAILVPLYFVRAGWQVDLRHFDTALITETVVVTVVAVLGKFGGAYAGARVSGETPRAAAEFATLMNTRGVTELAFLSIGLSLGVIDSAFYAAMVVMTMVTTAMTGPLLSTLSPQLKGV